MADSSVTFWVGKDRWPQGGRVRNLKKPIMGTSHINHREVPCVYLALGIAKRQGLLLQISGESDKPDLTVPDLEYHNETT